MSYFRKHSQRYLPPQTSGTLPVGFETTQNLNSGIFKWSFTVVVTTTRRCHKLEHHGTIAEGTIFISKVLSSIIRTVWCSAIQANKLGKQIQGNKLVTTVRTVFSGEFVLICSYIELHCLKLCRLECIALFSIILNKEVLSWIRTNASASSLCDLQHRLQSFPSRISIIFNSIRLNKIKARASCKELPEWEENWMRFQGFSNCHFQQEFLHRYCICIKPVVSEIPVISTVWEIS